MKPFIYGAPRSDPGPEPGARARGPGAGPHGAAPGPGALARPSPRRAYFFPVPGVLIFSSTFEAPPV